MECADSIPSKCIVIILLRVPTVGTHTQKQKHKGDNDPSRPNETQRLITNQKQQKKYPCNRIRETRSLKDK